MTRTNRSARQAGARFERLIADGLAWHLKDDRIERRVSNGAKDRGDIGGIRTPMGDRVVIECKDARRLELGVWMNEAEAERGNDDAAVKAIVHKRLGKGDVLDQYVTMEVRDLVVLLGGEVRDAPDHTDGSTT